MFESWDDSLGDTKEQILSAGGVKVGKGQFRMPDGTIVTPTGGLVSADPGDGTMITRRPLSPECEAIKARGNPTPAEAGRCGWGYGGIYTPPQPTLGLPKMDAGGITPKPTGDTGMETAPPTADTGGGLNLGFLSQPVFGIPLWMIAAGVGVVLLLKKR